MACVSLSLISIRVLARQILKSGEIYVKFEGILTIIANFYTDSSLILPLLRLECWVNRLKIECRVEIKSARLARPPPPGVARTLISMGVLGVQRTIYACMCFLVFPCKNFGSESN